jgi:hypothetical protein
MSRTYFTRLEPRTTSASLVPGLTARLFDPAWMLGRQWQVGELLGDDAGTPVSLSLDAETAMLASYQPSGGASVPYDPAILPLDAMAEPDDGRAATTWTARLRIDTGRALARELAAAGFGGYVAAFAADHDLAPPVDADRAADPAGASLLAIAAGRLPDGQKLYVALVPALRAGGVPLLPTAVAPNDAGPVVEALTAWLAWCDATVTEPGAASAWDDSDLTYGFGVATAGNEATLDAAHHRGGGLEWHSFTARPGAGSASFTRLPEITAVPTGARFRGMPTARWWEMEDGSVDLGDIDAGPSDVARMALLEFAFVYGNVFFVVPLRLPVGSLTRVTELVVVDSFGLRLRIQPASYGGSRQGAQRWSMFTLTAQAPGRPADGVSDLFFLPPIARHVLTGDPVEEVLLLRDEMADMAWAVEHSYEGGTGSAIRRAEQEPRAAAPTGPPPSAAPLRYLLGSTVPAYWFPLVPERAGGDVRLRLERMGNQDASDTPRGRLLAVDGRTFADAEIPREGRRLIREHVLARWSNGGTTHWSRRLNRVGRGEGSSGLRFDTTTNDAADH